MLNIDNKILAIFFFWFLQWGQSPFLIPVFYSLLESLYLQYTKLLRSALFEF